MYPLHPGKVFARERLTPEDAGRRGGGAVADVSDPSRTVAQQVPRFVAVVASKHRRHRRHRRPFVVIRGLQVTAESHPYARWRHQRLTSERCNTHHHTPRCEVQTAWRNKRTVNTVKQKAAHVTRDFVVSCRKLFDAMISKENCVFA